ncbi:MAG: flavodoxin family protein [Pseudomonadota bacterium]
MTRILAINGAYRENGITDQAVAALAHAIKAQHASVEVIQLRQFPIEFCLNCRECTQQPGTVPGHCIQHDAMQALVEKIESADGYILASPTNFGSVTALFKRFMERLVVYAYWPWGRPAPRHRKAGERPKPAILVSSSAAPTALARLAFHSVSQLKQTARTIGARPVGTLYTGKAGLSPHPVLPRAIRLKAEKMAQRLV